MGVCGDVAIGESPVGLNGLVFSRLFDVIEPGSVALEPSSDRVVTPVVDGIAGSVDGGVALMVTVLDVVGSDRLVEIGGGFVDTRGDGAPDVVALPVDDVVVSPVRPMTTGESERGNVVRDPRRLRGSVVELDVEVEDGVPRRGVTRFGPSDRRVRERRSRRELDAVPGLVELVDFPEAEADVDDVVEDVVGSEAVSVSSPDRWTTLATTTTMTMRSATRATFAPVPMRSLPSFLSPTGGAPGASAFERGRSSPRFPGDSFFSSGH